MYPILIIASSDWIARRLRDKRVHLAAAIGLLLMLQAVSSLTIAPHHFDTSIASQTGRRTRADERLT